MEHGPAGQAVAQNVRQLRQARRLSQPKLAERVTVAGRPMKTTAISKIETAERRVDVDDLMALAVALGVNPSRLLLPADVEEDVEVELTAKVHTPAWRAWQWMDGYAPFDDDLDDGDLARFDDFQRAVRPWPAEWHPVVRTASYLRAQLVVLVRRPSAAGHRGVARQLERLQFELDDLKTTKGH